MLVTRLRRRADCLPAFGSYIRYISSCSDTRHTESPQLTCADSSQCAPQTRAESSLEEGWDLETFTPPMTPIWQAIFLLT
jgi:hypothetical protein